MCGEEKPSITLGRLVQEIPPHVRRRAAAASWGISIIGNTSACAEKSGHRLAISADYGKYLRMCGEEVGGTWRTTKQWEIPPHVRRRGRKCLAAFHFSGNTSACAEKRPPVYFWPCHVRKYLRMCGEEVGLTRRLDEPQEIPPHVRRRVLEVTERNMYPGNTSACAEKRVKPNGARGHQRKYLRMCGEERTIFVARSSSTEIPPHVRRRV